MVNQRTEKQIVCCLTCRQSFDLAQSQTCPHCGQLADEHGAPILYQNPATKRGGKRPGAGAPRGNLNRLTHGRRSKLLERGVEKICQDPNLLAVLYLIAGLAESGAVPPETKAVIQSVIARTNVLKERGKKCHS